MLSFNVKGLYHRLANLKLYQRLFLAHPEIRYMWKFAEKLKTEDELRNNPRLKYHGKRIMETIGVALKSLSTLDVLNVVLLELGSRHYTYGVKPEHFTVSYSKPHTKASKCQAI